MNGFRLRKACIRLYRLINQEMSIYIHAQSAKYAAAFKPMRFYVLHPAFLAQNVVIRSNF